MLKDFHDNVVFENISNGKLDTRTEGIEEFEKQAKAATHYFQTRKQSIKSWETQENVIKIQISYQATLNIDHLPNGLKKGDTLNLQGEFEFEGEKIKKIRDRG